MGGGGGANRRGQGSREVANSLPHQSALCFYFPDFQRRCDSEKCTRAHDSLSAQRNHLHSYSMWRAGTCGVEFSQRNKSKCLIKRTSHIRAAFDVEGQKVITSSATPT